MNDVLTRLAPTAEEALPALCRRFGVRRLDLFGAAADGRFDPERSDLDFLVAFEDRGGGRRFFELLEALEKLFGRKVDLLDQSKVENPFIRRKIEGQRQQLFPATRMTGLVPGYVWHAKRSAESIRSFTAGRSFDDYETDKLLRSAVEREFITIGEALAKLRKADPMLAAGIPDLPEIVAFRNLLVHGYEVVQNDSVWRIVEQELAAFITVLDRLLAEAGEV